MGVSSVTEIYNSALLKCGVEPIISVSDESTRARLLNGCKDRVRQSLLRAHPWNFAKAMVALTAEVTTPLFDWVHEFTLPSNCMRVLRIDAAHDEPWAVMGNKLYANFSPINILYVKDMTDVTKYDDNFCEVLAWAYANEIIFTLTQVASVKEAIMKNYKEELALARSFNAQEGSTPRVLAESWLDRRRS